MLVPYSFYPLIHMHTHKYISERENTTWKSYNDFTFQNNLQHAILSCWFHLAMSTWLSSTSFPVAAENKLAPVILKAYPSKSQVSSGIGKGACGCWLGFRFKICTSLERVRAGMYVRAHAFVCKGPGSALGVLPQKSLTLLFWDSLSLGSAVYCEPHRSACLPLHCWDCKHESPYSDPLMRAKDWAPALLFE